MSCRGPDGSFRFVSKTAGAREWYTALEKRCEIPFLNRVLTRRDRVKKPPLASVGRSGAAPGWWQPRRS
jgi:hypothetical protein